MVGVIGCQDLSKGFKNVGSSALDKWIMSESAIFTHLSTLSSAFFDGAEEFLFLKTILAQ